jgi:hypothetical protein
MVHGRVRGALLRRHVGGRADGDAGGRDLRAPSGVGQCLGDAEVGHRGVPAGEHHVVRLDVAVNHPVVVGVRQRVGDLAEHAHGVGDRQRAFAPDAVPQRLAFDERHDVEQQALGLARIVERQDVGM